MRTALVIGVLVGSGSWALASPCGGGGDSSSSDSSSSGDSSHSWDSEPSPPCEGPCAEYRAWRMKNAPAVRFEIGLATRAVSSPLGMHEGSLTHDHESFTYRVVGPAAQPSAPLETAVVGVARLTIPLRLGFYVGAELEAGAVSGSAVAQMTSSGERGTPTITPTTTGLFGALGVAGVGGRISDALELGVEIAGGGRMLSYGYDSTYYACETSTAILEGAGVVEGRARAALWLNQHTVLGVTAGRSLLDDGFMGGVTIGFSNQPFGR